MNKLIIIIFAFTTIGYSQINKDSSDGGGGIIYGYKHAFILNAPKGWVLDNSSGVSDGLYAVFYPIGGSWQGSNTVMYANTASREVKVNATRDMLIAYDMQQFKNREPKINIRDSESLLTRDNKMAIVKAFYGVHIEAVAYIEERSIIVLLTISANTEKQFNDAFPAFKELVSSYMVITDDVKDNEK